MMMALVGCPGDDSTSTPPAGSSTGTTNGTTNGTPPVTTGGPNTGSATDSTSTGTVDSTTADPDSTTGAESSSGTTMGISGGSTSTGPGNTTEMAESSGTTMGISGGSSSSGMNFIQDPDGGGIPMECDVFLQNCPAGDKCMPWDSSGGGSWDALMCAPIDANTVGTGDVCLVVGSGTSGIDNCELGSMCWDVDGATNEGTCVEMCTGSLQNPVCAPANTSCVISNNDVLVLCLPGCDPLMQNCPGNQACYPVNGNFTCAPDASGAQGADGDPCEFINVCDPGLMCIAAASVEACVGASGCCTPYCDVTDPVDPCPAATESCVAFFPVGQAPAGLEDVGVCAVP